MDVRTTKILNIIFIIIFGILLIVPVTHIDTSEKVYGGKTYLKNFPSLYDSMGNFNENAGWDFDLWLSSRFFTKDELMKLNKLYACFFNSNFCVEKNQIFDKKNKVIYTSSFFGLRNKKWQNIYYKKIVAKNIQQLNDWCKKRNIKLYILAVPRRADFIKYDSPSVLNKISSDKAEELIKYAQENTDAKIIFPYNEMQIVNKYSPVYFKTDHHWTPTGAYVGYHELIKEIQKDFPDVKLFKKEDFKITKSKKVKGLFFSKYNNGSMMENSGYLKFYAKDIMDTEYEYYSSPLEKYITITKESPILGFSKETDYVFKNSAGERLKVVLIGDSFTSNLVLFLPYSFKEILCLLDNYRKSFFNEYENIIETYKPDIIIINMRTVWLWKFFKNL